ncbi:MAG: hypothetical protein RLY20_1479 [Verrucomicrobiota bacterium]
MKLERWEQSIEPKRLEGQLQARGVQNSTSSVGLLVLGFPFAAIGVWAILAGSKLIAINPASLHAPHWVLAVCGIVFALGGIMVWSMGWKQWRAERRRQQSRAKNGNEPALADYPWDPRGFTPPRWSRALKMIGGATFATLFISIFQWWALQGGPLLLKLFVGIMDLFLLFVWFQALLLAGRTAKFGASRIEFVRFPFRPSETAIMRWIVPTGVRRMTNGTFTLRCVEEWYEVRGSGKNQSRMLVQEQVWAATGHVMDPRELIPGKTEEIQFEIPADARSSSLSGGGRTVFWELAIDLDLAGLDFKEAYLVPVYRQA